MLSCIASFFSISKSATPSIYHRRQGPPLIYTNIKGLIYSTVFHNTFPDVLHDFFRRTCLRNNICFCQNHDEGTGAATQVYGL